MSNVSYNSQSPRISTPSAMSTTNSQATKVYLRVSANHTALKLAKSLQAALSQLGCNSIIQTNSLYQRKALHLDLKFPRSTPCTFQIGGNSATERLLVAAIAGHLWQVRKTPANLFIAQVADQPVGTHRVSITFPPYTSNTARLLFPQWLAAIAQAVCDWLIIIERDPPDTPDSRDTFRAARDRTYRMAHTGAGLSDLDAAYASRLSACNYSPQPQDASKPPPTPPASGVAGNPAAAASGEDTYLPKTTSGFAAAPVIVGGTDVTPNGVAFCDATRGGVPYTSTGVVTTPSGVHTTRSGVHATTGASHTPNGAPAATDADRTTPQRVLTIAGLPPNDFLAAFRHCVTSAVHDATLNGRAGLTDWHTFLDTYDINNYFAALETALIALPARSSSCRAGAGATSPAAPSGEGVTFD